ncbi:PREDICTED: breast cancer type 2 susceptibility protein [Nanorana parkeri]|uniref:breast cancer type 2 susceptibility protein n=1 Tax=Nanorana parkeri TaxID=125878 RepID=UPI0008547BA3|nr:PREDICTED: breast cancer type 2 susceptibility protein [Nanorana parkeri]
MASVQMGSSVFMHLLHAHCAASDLGPISVNWFEELTAEAVQRQPKLCVDEEKRAEDLDDCLFKTPKHKQPNYSQLDSTPIIFKEQSLCSPLFLSPARDLPKNQPVAENVRRVNRPEGSPGDSTQLPHNEVFGTSRQCHNHSPSVMREIFKTPLWDKKYTHRTPQRDGKNDVFDSLCCTPKLIRNTTPRCISESLGAEADPEMSWSSSLATPPSPTVIIAQANDETSRMKPFDNKDAVIVRSLFSKLCNNAETSSIAAPTDPMIGKDLHTKADDHVDPAGWRTRSSFGGGHSGIPWSLCGVGRPLKTCSAAALVETGGGRRRAVRAEVTLAARASDVTSGAGEAASRASSVSERAATVSDSSADSEEDAGLESGEDTGPSQGRYLFPAHETNELLKSVWDTLGISEEQGELSIHDRLYKGLQPKKGRTFPVHQSIKHVVTTEWKDPERKVFFSSKLKRRFPFKGEDSEVWEKCPKVDASLAKFSKNTDLSFEDMGLLKDPMDKKGEALLRRAWEAAGAGFKPAVAVTCMARTLDVWLAQLKDHLNEGTDRATIVDSLPVLEKAVAYIADASMEAVRISARTTALINSSRRALWLKTWPGDVASKTKLCGIPFGGNLLSPSHNDGAAIVGGRLRDFLPQWLQITDSVYVLNLIRRGCRIELLQIPPSRFLVTCLSRDPAKSADMTSAIQKLLHQEVICSVPVMKEKTGFYSHVFLRKKPSGGFRVILNLKPLNKVVRYKRFRMESIYTIRELLLPAMFLATVDLRDAYLHIPMAEEAQRLLRFAIQGPGQTLHFQYKALPFGLSSAPRVFTKVLAEALAPLRLHGIGVIPYLDDLFFASDQEPLRMHLGGGHAPPEKPRLAHKHGEISIAAVTKGGIFGLPGAHGGRAHVTSGRESREAVKVVSIFHRTQEVVIPSFCANPTNEKEAALQGIDVRRCVLEYLDKTKETRKSNNLFVLFSGPKSGLRASKSSIGRWIKMAIHQAYALQNLETPQQSGSDVKPRSGFRKESSASRGPALNSDSTYAVCNEEATGTFESSESLKVPKNIMKNEDACRTTDNVLEGMEDVLSIFFNSGKPQGLRKVKVDSRAKRRRKLDSNVVQESTDDQKIFPDDGSQNKCNKSEPTNKHAMNYDPSTMPSSYEWSPLALPDLNTTQGDMHLQGETDHVIYGEVKELGPSITNYSPTRNNEQPSLFHVPDGPCEVANNLEMCIPNTVQQKLLDRRLDVNLTHSAQNNTRDTVGTTSTGQQVLGEMNERRPQKTNTNIKAKLSVLKRQSKFLYCLNGVKNGQDGTTMDISKDSHKALDSLNAACTHSHQDAELAAKEASEYLKEDSLDILEIEENLLNLKHVDRPISEQVPCLETTTYISTAINKELDVKMTVNMKTGDVTGKISLLESNGTSKKNTLDDNAVGHSDFISAKNQVQECALSSAVTSDHKEQLEIHKGSASTTTENHNTCTDGLPHNVSPCITKFKNFGGFKTASNKNINISEDSLRKGELLFEDDDPSYHNSHPLPPTADINNPLDVVDSTSLFNGFRTASRKEIVVAESKIAKGMLLFKDIEDGICENLTKEDLLLRPTANLVPASEKARRPDNNFEPLSKLSSEEAKDKKQTSDILTLDKQSSIEVKPKGTSDQYILLPQHSKDSTSNQKSQMRKSLSSEIQSQVCGILTESQKAEVSELSSILENAGSQFDFSQFRKTGIVPSNNNNQNLQSAEDGISESENLNNSDVWQDVDFNDSFAAGAEHIENMDSSVKLSLEREDNTVRSTACDTDVVSASEKSVSKAKERKCAGFSLASGKCINITDEDMIKAFELFSDSDDTTLSLNNSSTDVNKRLINSSSGPATLNVQEIPKDCITVPHNVKKSSIVHSKTESYPQCEEGILPCNVPMFNIAKQNSKTQVMNEFVYGGNDIGSSAEAFCAQTVSQGCLPSGSCVSAMPVGFSTGKGKVINVDKAALVKAKAIFNDILHPESIYKNQGGTSSVTVKESISTIGQGEDGNGTHILTDEQSAADFITSGKGAAVPHDSVQIGRQMSENISGSEMTRCISLPKQDTPVLKRVQFSTACSKPVHLSAESWNRAREMFADIDNQQLGTVGENSKDSLCAVEKITTGTLSTNNIQDIISKTLQEREPVLPPLGFSTASGKSVVVSCDSLHKARAMFAEADIAMHDGLEGMESKQMHDGAQFNPAEIKLRKPKIKDCDVTIKKTARVTTDVLPPLGFSTASGKIVAVSNESLEKARLMLADTDNIDMKHEFQSSQTRLGKGNRETSSDVLCSLEIKKPGKVNLAEGSPMKPSFRESTTGFCVEKPDIPSIVKKSRFAGPRVVSLPQENAPSIMKPSFSTAGGKPVHMSDEALKKAREMFAKIDDGQLDAHLFKQRVERNTKWENTGNSNLQDQASPTVPAKETTFTLPVPGFSTASGKTVAVSADALHKASILFADGDDDGNTNENIGQSKIRAINAEQYEVNEMVSKPVTLHSDTEFQSFRSPLKQNSGISTISGNVPGNICKVLMSNSFSTASGKTVNVSEDALKKAKEKLSEIDKCLLPQDKPGDVFSDLPLCVSKVHTSLQKKPTDQTTLEASETSKLSNTTTTTFGFSTASGKLVSVSETAIQKVKDLFEESEHLQDHCQYNDKGDGNINKKANVLSPLVDKPETISHLNEKLGDLQNYRARTIENTNVDKPSIARFSNIQHPMLRHSTPFHNTGVLGKKNCVSSITSHTPENYFEIEAAESAKAFMDDENLTDGMRSAEATNKPLNPRNGKRLRSDDRTPHGEPPIKRKLLPEFDRSSMQGSKLTLNPLTSSPHSELKDRRKFLYNVSLKASFCDPTSFSAREKVAQVSQVTTRSHFYSRSAAFQQSSSDNTADASDDGRQLNTLLSYRPATGRFVSPLKVADHTSSEEQTHDQTDLEPHNGEGKLEHEKCPEFVSDFSQLLSSVRCARDLQEMRIWKKQRQKIKPHPGSLYQLKSSSADRIPLVSAVQGMLPTVYTKTQLYRFGVLKNHIGINSETAKKFDFHCPDYFTKNCLLPDGGVRIADGGWLVPSDKLTAGREEFYRALCDTTGVDPKLISPEWVYNHYRWIVWKLAAMEVRFPELFASRCLTPERVLLQLKYRYEVEIDKSRRSALKKIMERDDTAAKTLVLCVSKVISWHGNDKSESNDPKQGSAVIEVTDGWYGIKALLDTSLTALLHRGRLFVGQKIIVHGAELVGSEDACTPLEAPESLMLKFSANSTRPARWYTRLGYFCDPRPFCLPLSFLFAEGGIVGCVNIVIQRIYPMQWMEKMANGTYVFRNDRAEEREAERHSSKQQKNLEALFLKIQEEFEQQEACERKVRGKKRSSLSVNQIAALQDGAELYEALQNEPDPGYLESCMSDEQLRALNHHRQLINDKKQALIQTEFRKAIESAEQGSGGCARREVTPVWKMRIVDYKEQDPTSAYMLNIWRPLPDLVSLLKEGCRFKIYQLAVSQSKCKAVTAAVQLTATKKTQFQQLQPAQDVLEQIYTERQVTDFSRLLEPNFTIEYGEVDLVGFVISTHQKIGGAPIVYLSDEACDIVAVKFWTDLSLVELAKPGTFIAASNLRWRSESTAGIPMVLAGDLSYIAANPKEPHLQKAIHKLRQSVQCLFYRQPHTAVKFWTDLSLVELAKPGTFIAASNLRWRSESTAGIPMVLAGDLSYIAANPKEPHLQKAIHKLRQSVQAVQKFRHEAESKLLNILRVPHPEERRSLAQQGSDSHTAASKFSTPVAKLGRAQMNAVSTPDRSNVIISSGSDTDPRTCKKMKGLDFLSRIPSPPPLTPVRPLVSPPLQKAFRPPRSMQKDVQPVLMSKGEFVADEELAMINTQALISGLEEGKIQPKAEMSADVRREKISPNPSEEKLNPPGSSSHTDIDMTTKKEDPGFTEQGRLRTRKRHRL